MDGNCEKKVQKTAKRRFGGISRAFSLQNISMTKFGFAKKTATISFMLAAAVLSFGASVSASAPLIVIADGREYVFFQPELKIEDGVYVLSGLDEIVDRIYLDTLKKPVDAKIDFTPGKDKPFSITREKNGREVNKARLKAEILYALDSGKRKVTVGADALAPEITEAYLREETILRSRFVTCYGSSSPERKNNIELACKSLNGAIIDSEGVLSFNERVGERTEERGYRTAKIIVDGKFADGLGGGVCQVSTTLYNSALRAGLPVEEYHPHSLAVSYVPPSFDAMVSGAACDLRIRNDTGRRIYVSASADGTNVTIVFYGIGSECEYRFSSTIDGILRAKTQIVDRNSGISPIKPKDGMKSSAYVSVFRGGVLVSSKKLRSDVYAPIDGIVYAEE